MLPATLNPITPTSQTEISVWSSTAVLGAGFSKFPMQVTDDLTLQCWGKTSDPATPGSEVFQSCVMVVKAAFGIVLVLSSAPWHFQTIFFSEAIRLHQPVSQENLIFTFNIFHGCSHAKKPGFMCKSLLGCPPKWLLLTTTAASFLAWTLLNSSKVHVLTMTQKSSPKTKPEPL